MIIQKICQALHEIKTFFISLNPRYKETLNERKNFARRIALELSILNSQDTWKDDRYSELEAEVEAEDNWYQKSFWIPFGRKHKGIHREKNLSIALTKNRDRMILLEGEPGSGKSIVMRHLAQKLAEKASTSKSINEIIPIYINLKDFQTTPIKGVSANDIRSYILSSLNKNDDRNMALFLEKEFEGGIKSGSWLFLFDSLDEMPAILRADDVNEESKRILIAIQRFLYDQGKCRCIVTSRFFHIASGLNWSKFRIQRLNWKQKCDIIKKSGLSKGAIEMLINDIKFAPPSVVDMTNNPLFLSLLCENIKDGKKFPDHIYNVFEDFIDTRLDRDANRLETRYGINKYQIRNICNEMAFCMTMDHNLGLSSPLQKIYGSLIHNGFELSTNFDISIDAITYTKIGYVSATKENADTIFSFSHRRLQEYFTTCEIIKDKNRITPYQLLTDQRWHDITATMLQTQSEDVLSNLFDQAETMIKSLKDQIVCEKFFYKISHINIPDEKIGVDTKDNQLPEFYQFPEQLIYLLNLLNEGLGYRREIIPQSLSVLIEEILLPIFDTGLLLNKKQVLEYCPLMRETKTEQMLISGIEYNNNWINDVIYKQIPKLRNPPIIVTKRLNTVLVDQVLSGEYFDDKYTNDAYIQRLPKYEQYKNKIRMMKWMSIISFVSTILFCFPIFFFSIWSNFYFSILIYGLIIYCFFFSDMLIFGARKIKFLREFFLSNKSLLEYCLSTRMITLYLLLGYYLYKILKFYRYYYLIDIQVAFYIFFTFLVIIITQLMWPTAYFVYIDEEKILHPLLWCLIPFIAIYQIPKKIFGRISSRIKALKDSCSELILNLKIPKLKRTAIYMLAAIILVVTGILGLLIIILLMLIPRYKEILVPIYFEFAIIYMSIFLVFWMWHYLWVLFTTVKTSQMLKISNVDFITFFKLLSSTRSTNSEAMFIKAIYNKKLLNFNRDTFMNLQRIISITQYGFTQYKNGIIVQIKPSRYDQLSQFDTELLNNLGNNKIKYGICSKTTLTYLCKFLEEYEVNN